MRLTPHDGLSNVVVELGLMGRRCISNDWVPNAIPWTPDPARIVATIRAEQVHVGRTDEDTADAVRAYVNIGEAWLDTDYYEE